MDFQPGIDLLSLPELFRKYTLLDLAGIIKGKREETVCLYILDRKTCFCNIRL